MADATVVDALYSSRHVPRRKATQVKPEPSNRSEDDHQVLPFRPRPGTKPAARHARPTPEAASPVETLAKYEAEDGDNYRHRMMVNLAALLVTIALAVAGGWLALQLADLRKKQDCVLSGRTNCMRIETTAPRSPGG